MSWVPVNLSASCSPFSTLSSCQPSAYIFLHLVTSIFGNSEDTIHQHHYNKEDISDNTLSDYEYDFIIVGAGTAGCLLANRLSKIKDWKILLLEAGGEEPEVAKVPAFAIMMQRSSIDWNFRTQAQPLACTARIEGRCDWPRGKVMGGTSAINYMIYLRGGPKDFDEWAALGNTGWAFTDVLPYFKDIEDNRNIDKVGRLYHGIDGDWTVQYFPFQDQNVHILLQALAELGYEVFDQNGGKQVGASLIQHATRNGERLSANVAFIRPIRNKRENLTILTNCFVTKVLIDTDNKIAYGVEFLYKNQIMNAVAKKEVILSAGVIGSPKILMLSGIGPKDHLQEMGISVIQELSVGHNLHDHTTIDGVIIRLTNITSTLTSPEQRMNDVYGYIQTHEGILSGTSTLQVNAYIQTQYEREPDRPDIQFSLDTVNVRNFYTDPIETQQASSEPISYYDGIMIRPVLLVPSSRGVILLNKSDPVFGDPLIYANTFQEQIDLLRMVDGIRQGINLVNTKTLQNIGASLVTIPLPACRSHLFGTDEYWNCVCRSYTSTLYHPVGTCKMGPTEDPTAVVSPQLKVHGIDRLRVVDASIMPIVTRANTNTATLLIAQKAIDLIMSNWKFQENGW